MYPPTIKESTVAQIEPIKKNDLSLNKVEFTQVDQPGSVGLSGHLKGFWITFSTIFKKPETIEYPEVKAPTRSAFMVTINSIDIQMVLRSALAANSARGHARQMQSMSRVPITRMKNACHRVSDTARFIRLTICAVSFVDFA